MTTREFDPRRLDVAIFARQAAEIDGAWPLTALSRVVESASPDALPGDADEAVWSARGESRPVRGAEAQPWLHLRGQARVSLVCQRCLGPVAVDLDFDRSFTFVADEEEAARLDEQSDDDVLALGVPLDLRQLVEDELLLAMPLVPRHDVCPVPLVAPTDACDEGDEAPSSPFAALAALKRDPRPN